MKNKILILVLLLLLVLGSSSLIFFNCFKTIINKITNGFNAPEPIPTLEPLPTSKAILTPEPIPTPKGIEIEITKEFKESLTKGKWNDSAITAFLRTNLTFLEIVKEENEAKYYRTLKQLSSLPNEINFAETMNVLEKHPELSGVYKSLNAISINKLNKIVGQAGQQEKKYNLLCSNLMLNANPDDLTLIIEIFNDFYEQIYDLTEQGVLSPESFFVSSPGEGQEIYKKWLKDLALNYSHMTDRGKVGIITFVTLQSKYLQKRLKTDKSFRTKFDSSWRKLYLILSSVNNFEDITSEPKFWDLIMHPSGKGESLIRKFGTNAVDLLFGCSYVGSPPSYPPELHETIIEILESEKKDAIELLLRPEIRGKLDFQEFLKSYQNKKIELKLLIEALSDLNSKEGLAFNTRLELFNKLSKNPTDLNDVIKPPKGGLIICIPGYTIYELGHKLSQGRDPDAMDWIFAGIDLVTIIIPVKGGSAVKTILNPKDVIKKTAMENAKINLGKMGGATTKLIEKNLETSLVDYSANASRQVIQAEIKKASSTAVFDLTKLITSTYKFTGLGRNTFNNITGLEARLFMRKDAKVVVSFESLSKSSLGLKARLFLNETAINATSEKILTNPEVQYAAKELFKTLKKIPDEVEAWRMHSSAWFLIQ